MKPRTAVIVVFAALALLASGHALLGRGDAAQRGNGAAIREIDGPKHTTTPALDNRSAESSAARSRIQVMAGLPGSRRDERSAAATSAGSAPAPPVAADAAQSLAQALQHGDDRSPPIARDSTPAETPTAAELADPVAYRRYENRQQARLYRAFQTEATIALGDMERDIARARAQGLPPELIAEGEEKQRRLEQTLRALENGELQ